MPHSIPSEADPDSPLAVDEQDSDEAAPANDTNGHEPSVDILMGEADEADAATADVEKIEHVEEEEAGIKEEGSEEQTDTAEEKKNIKLEDLFSDLDTDDDEFPGSSAPASGVVPNPPKAPPPGDLGRSDTRSLENMRAFYQRLFPWRYLFQWLNHSPTPANDFKHREFAFTLQNDAYLRYQSFNTADLLRKDVLRLMPSRFEIGPVYSTNPRDRKTLRNSSAFKPLAKELCFDIDLTDYDDIRTCCKKADICLKCWQFMTMAIKVVDAALRDDFGFKHILWVYSGRRGVHAWVCDKKVRRMDDEKRRAIAGYLEVVRGGAESGKKVNLERPLHPHLTRSLDLLKDHFQTDVLSGQNPWQSPEQAERLLQLLPKNRELVEALREKWMAESDQASTARWADIDEVARDLSSNSLDPEDLLDAKQDIVLEYTYPRLDIEVSKKLNHLLKSPFVVHPGTGRVCVPIDTSNLDDFDPKAVPNLPDLLDELDISDEAGNEAPGRHGQDWEKTSLRPYMEYFKAFVLELMKDERDVAVKHERDEDGGAMDF